MNEGGERPKDEGGKDIPEVEAELVQETAAPADAFDDAAPSVAPQADAEPDAPPARKKTLTPGVILFIAFSLAALGVFAYWRFQERPASTQEPAAAAPAPESGQEAAQQPAETSVPEVAAPETDSENKIANTAPDDMKRPDAPPQADSGADAVKPEGFLPPVGGAGAAKLSNDIEDGAKETMREFREEANTQEEAAAAPPLDTPSTDSVDRFDIENPAPGATDAEPDGEMGPGEADTLAPSPSSAAADPAPAKIDNDLTALKQEFAAEAQRLEMALADERQRSSEQAAEISSLRAELSAALAARDQAVEGERAALRAEMEKIRNEDVKVSAQHMKASFALAALTRAIDQGDPYTEELAAISQFEPDAESALAAHAETGVPAEAALRERFGAAARAGLAAAAQEKAGGGFSGLVARAASVISVRPASPQAGDSPGAVLSRAEHALGQGETAFALLQLEDLPLVAQTAMADWIADARARAEAEAALATLQARLAGEQE